MKKISVLFVITLVFCGCKAREDLSEVKSSFAYRVVKLDGENFYQVIFKKDETVFLANCPFEEGVPTKESCLAKYDGAFPESDDGISSLDFEAYFKMILEKTDSLDTRDVRSDLDELENRIDALFANRKNIHEKSLSVDLFDKHRRVKRAQFNLKIKKEGEKIDALTPSYIKVKSAYESLKLDLPKKILETLTFYELFDEPIIASHRLSKVMFAPFGHKLGVSIAEAARIKSTLLLPNSGLYVFGNVRSSGHRFSGASDWLYIGPIIAGAKVEGTWSHHKHRPLYSPVYIDYREKDFVKEPYYIHKQVVYNSIFEKEVRDKKLFQGGLVKKGDLTPYLMRRDFLEDVHSDYRPKVVDSSLDGAQELLSALRGPLQSNSYRSLIAVEKNQKKNAEAARNKKKLFKYNKDSYVFFNIEYCIDEDELAKIKDDNNNMPEGYADLQITFGFVRSEKFKIGSNQDNGALSSKYKKVEGDYVSDYCIKSKGFPYFKLESVMEAVKDVE